MQASARGHARMGREGSEALIEETGTSFVFACSLLLDYALAPRDTELDRLFMGRIQPCSHIPSHCCCPLPNGGELQEFGRA